MANETTIFSFMTTETGALNPLVWVVAIMVAVFSILFVFMLVWFIIPARGSPAKHFIKGKREKKPVFFLDAGKFFKCVVGDQKVGKEKAQVWRNGQDIIKGGQGMKFCESVLMGVGEDFRSLTVNVGIVDLMELIEAKGWNAEEVKTKLKSLEDQLKKDLGLTDELKALKEKYTTEQVHLMFEAERSSQSRGEPALTSSIKYIDYLTKYVDAELVRRIEREFLHPAVFHANRPRGAQRRELIHTRLSVDDQ